MFTTEVELRRLNLLHLEEYEVLTEEIPCECSYTLPGSDQLFEEKGKLHICSKSVIFESDKYSTPILKFLFKYLQGEFKLGRIP